MEKAYIEAPSAGHMQEMCYVLSFISFAKPMLRQKIDLPRWVISRWTKPRPTQRALSLTEHTVFALSQLFRREGSAHAAIAVFVQPRIYMSGSAALFLRKKNIVFPKNIQMQHTGSNAAGIYIKSLRTGFQSSTPLINHDCIVIVFLCTHMSRTSLQASEYIFDVRSAEYISLFGRAAIFVRLSGKRFSTHTAHIGAAFLINWKIPCDTIAFNDRGNFERRFIDTYQRVEQKCSKSGEKASLPDGSIQTEDDWYFF